MMWPLAINLITNHNWPVWRKREGTAVVPVTSFNQATLETKQFIDTTGNNVNHPNDFLARAYAHACLREWGDFDG